MDRTASVSSVALNSCLTQQPPVVIGCVCECNCFIFYLVFIFGVCCGKVFVVLVPWTSQCVIVRIIMLRFISIFVIVCPYTGLCPHKDSCPGINPNPFFMLKRSGEQAKHRTEDAPASNGKNPLKHHLCHCFGKCMKLRTNLANFGRT